MSEVQTYLIQGTHFEISRAPNQPTEKFVRIGDRVKVMKKQYDGWKTFPGIIVSFDDFKDMPTFNIVYVEASYSSCNLHSVAFNEESKDIKVSFLADDSKEIDIDRTGMIKYFERAIEAKKNELSDLMYKMSYFEKNFGKFFGGI